MVRAITARRAAAARVARPPLTACQPRTAGSDDAEYDGELRPYLAGEKAAPLPTYFVGGAGAGARAALAALADAPACGVRYLGRAGVATLKGLTVAFLDGAYSAAAFAAPPAAEPALGCRHFGAADVAALRAAVDAAESDVDILLTCDWPAGVAAALPAGAEPAGAAAAAAAAGAPPLAELALAARPRYLAAGGRGAFFARAPYLNADRGAGAHATRFLGLGAVGNAGKQKWLHALALTPAAEMAAEALAAAPPGATPCPFASAAAAAARKRAADADDGLGDQAWRWQERGGKRPRAPAAAPSLGRPDVLRDHACTVFVRNVPFAASEEELLAFYSRTGAVEDLVRRANAEGRLNSFAHVQFADAGGAARACQLNGGELMGRQLFVEPAAAPAPPKPPRAARLVDGCWFCLSSAGADVDLVVSVGEECYVALDKGPISDRHVLVLPVEHHAASVNLPAAAAEEAERYLSALRSFFASEGRALVGFERFMRLRKSGGNHCHVNALGLPAAAAAGAEAAFHAAAEKHGFMLTRVEPALGAEAGRAALAAAAGEGEYFCALLPDGAHLVAPIAFGKRHPLAVGREVLAALAGDPARADWKACAAGGAAEEAARAAAFKAAFEPFDVVLQGAGG